MQRKKLYLVDGNSHCYRAYYALGNLSTSRGRPSGAIYGVVNMLNKLREQMHPDYLAVCFDLKDPTFRHKMFKDYKVHRKPMPDDLQSQIETIKEVILAYGIQIFECSGYEADDIMATLALKLKSRVDVYIVSNDKDMLQLVDKYVKIYQPQKEREIFDEEAVFERYKVKPSQIADLLALAGDSTDNILGIPGIGPKTAADLIGRFGSLEKILENIDQISQEKRRNLLIQFSEQARLSKKLACLEVSVPVKIDLGQLKIASEDREKLKRIFQEFEFKNLLRSLLAKDPAVLGDISITTIDCQSKLSAFSGTLEKLKELSINITADKDGSRNILKLQIGKNKKEIIEIVIGNKLSVKELKQILEPVFNNPNILKIGYDLKKDAVLLRNIGLHLEGPFFDIMVAAYLLEPGRGTLKFEDIADHYLGRGVAVKSEVAEQLNIKDVLANELQSKGLHDLFYSVEMPLAGVLAAMEFEGIKVDRELLLTMAKQTAKKLIELTARIYKVSGCHFNINSSKQLSEILFKQLKLPVIKRGKTGPSTDVEVLMRLSNEHALPAIILEYRELAKLKSTYLDGLLELISQKTQKLYTSFNQTVTATGRLSSSSPNLQNIPIRTEAGRQIRAAFIARTQSWQLVCADYSQIELRVLAHLSKDKQLSSAFKQDLDVHAFTASLIFGVDKKIVSKKMRDLAKRVNFGIIYGIGAYGLAKDIGVSQDEAKKFIDEYFQRYPQVKVYLQAQIKKAESKGYITTLLNRRRYIPQINSGDLRQRAFAQRIAMNTPIQGTAADLIKVAMVNIYRAFKKEGLKAAMVLQVHDELVFDVPQEELKRVKKIVKDIMENVLKLAVPIKVSLKTGINWRDVK